MRRQKNYRTECGFAKGQGVKFPGPAASVFRWVDVGVAPADFMGMRILFALLVSALGGTVVAAAVDALVVENLQWRAERVARLTKPDGWLTLIGLHFLKEGENTVGRAPGNDVVLAQGPARVGVVRVAPDGKVTLEVAAGAAVSVDGKTVRQAELKWNVPSAPTRVVFGTVSMYVVDRGGRKALRVKDSEAGRRTRFAGLEYFPFDPAWRISARWIPFEKTRTIPVTNVLGQVSHELVAGKAVFAHADRTVELLAIDEGPEEPLFFVISDATSGKATYGGGRHLYAARPRGDAILLDFNQAQNPPCAFTPFATCPVPPKENRLPIAVTAGEKTYRGSE
jgi:uncharacterized protein (DUF1684 family)